MTEQPPRPTSILDDPGLGPKGPWRFLRAAARGGFNSSGLCLMGAWLLLALAPAFLWASYLMSHTTMGEGWSALPAHWGEQLNAKDMVELFDRGEVHGLLGFGTSTALILAIVFVAWASWNHQAGSAGLRPKLGAWLGGALDTVLAGIPILIVFALTMTLLSWLGRIGIPGLSWFAFLGKPVLMLATSSALMMQWWLMRLNRLDREGQNWATHFGFGFLRMWSHPVQWFGLAAGLTLLRLAMHGAVVDLAWRMGGGTVGRVWMFVLLEGLAAVIGAWILGWMLRTVSLFWRHDQTVRIAIAELKAATAGSTASTADA